MLMLNGAGLITCQKFLRIGQKESQLCPVLASGKVLLINFSWTKQIKVFFSSIIELYLTEASASFHYFTINYFTNYNEYF